MASDDDYDASDDIYDPDEDDFDEPCGICDECEGNLYEDDTYYDDEGFQFCGQCWWLITGGTGESNPTPEAPDAN